MSGRNPVKDSVIIEDGPIVLPPLLPEKMASTEIGYKGLFRGNVAFNFHWQSGFLWESGFGAGDIPAFSTLDGHISYSLPRIHTTLKLGASNMLNSYYTTSFGSANIGGLYYFTIAYNDIMGYLSKKN